MTDFTLDELNYHMKMTEKFKTFCEKRKIEYDWIVNQQRSIDGDYTFKRIKDNYIIFNIKGVGYHTDMPLSFLYLDQKQIDYLCKAREDLIAFINKIKK